MKHESHEWVEISPEEDGLFCELCEICSCHDPEEALAECNANNEESN